MCYELHYVEKSDRGHGSSWAKRRIGVYHKFRSEDQHDSAIVLHTGRNSRAHQRFISSESIGHEDRGLSLGPQRPFLVHSLVLSSFLRNWRWYLDELSGQCAKFVSKIRPSCHPKISPSLAVADRVVSSFLFILGEPGLYGATR